MAKSKISKEDAALLRYSGMMGHEFVGIYTGPKGRQTRCEANSLESAKQSLASDANAAVYRSIGKGKWELAWTATA